MRNVKDVFFQNNAGPKNMIGGMVTFHKASTFGLHLPKKARKHEHFGSRGAPHLSPLPPNVTLSGYLFTTFKNCDGIGIHIVVWGAVSVSIGI
jgi:hypothetical protein